MLHQHVDSFDHDLVRRRMDAQNLAGLAFILAGDDFHHVILLDLHRSFWLEHLGRKRNNLGKAFGAKFARDRTENATAARLFVFLVDKHDRVVVESDIRPVFAARLLPCSNDNTMGDLALLDGTVRQRLLNGNRHDIADAGIALLVSAKHANALDAARSGVIC